jgi:hypothetical protein
MESDLKKEIKISKEGVNRLYGIDFTMKEGSTKGYYPLDEMSDKVGRSQKFLENLLIKYRLFDRNGEFDEDEIVFIYEEPPEGVGRKTITSGCYVGIVCLSILREGHKTAEICFNHEFVKKLIAKDFIDFESKSDQENNAENKASELIDDVSVISKRSTVASDCWNDKCSHNHNKSCCLKSINMNVGGQCMDNTNLTLTEIVSKESLIDYVNR